MRRIVSMDPGTRNFALSVIKAKAVDGQLKYRVEGSSMLNTKNILHDMKTMQASIHRFLDYLDPVLSSGVTDIVIERFQARGNKGPTIESICCMIGALAARYPHIQMTAYTAATWKNAYNRVSDLKELYEDHKDLRKDKSTSHIQIHQLDATLMGLYHAAKHYSLTPYQFITDLKTEKEVLARLDSVQPLQTL